jgi:dTDP-4-dehydrorhamnose reductase
VKILLFGKNGQLGRELNKHLPSIGSVISVGRSDVDLENADDIRAAIREERPEIVINAAAYTAVDLAETEKERALKVNHFAPEVMALESKRIGAVFIHFSTDYVFNGMKPTPYVEDDACKPINFYGYSKWMGEQAVMAAGGDAFIFRTSWVYSLQQGGFVNKVLQWARTQDVMRVVDDQIGCPTWAGMLADATASVLTLSDLRSHAGLFHLAGRGAASRLEWARRIIELDPSRQEHKVRELLPAKTADFSTPAARPLYSVLDCSAFERTFGLDLPNWGDSLRLALGG